LQYFDPAVLTFIFPADEFEPSPISTIPAPIPIVDDSVNEATEQAFVALLRVANAPNPGLLSNDVINISTCVIVDNDGEQCLCE